MHNVMYVGTTPSGTASHSNKKAVVCEEGGTSEVAIHAYITEVENLFSLLRKV